MSALEAVTEELTFSTLEVSVIVGVTYRMLDYWLRKGAVTIEAEQFPGSGHSRRWTLAEVNHLRRMVEKYREAQHVLEAMSTGALWAETA